MLDSFFSQHPHWPIVDKIAEKLMAQGHRVALAGGCVRDALLGQMAQDLDIATDATPEQVGSCFEKVLYIGKSFGVCRVVEEGVSIEVATFREESDYRDGRHPEKVVYSTLEADARRRDFTVNAMYFDLGTQELIDLVGGQKDVLARRLVTVGDPVQRFQEDRLRLLRAARFAGQLDFALDPATQKAMIGFAGELDKLSKERIHDEFHKAYKSQKPVLFFEILNQTGLLAALLPDLIWEKIINLNGKSKKTGEVIREFSASKIPSPSIGWALLIWTRQKTGKEKTDGEAWLKTFKLPLNVVAEAALIAQGESFFAVSENQLTRFIEIVKSGAAENFEFFWRRLSPIFGSETMMDLWDKFKARYLVDGELPVALVTGKDLVAVGIEPGAEFKRLLERAYHRQLGDGALSKAEILSELKK